MPYFKWREYKPGNQGNGIAQIVNKKIELNEGNYCEPINNNVFFIMNQNLVHIAVVVDDYDKAIDFYINKLHFTLKEDTVLSDTKRWVLVTPKGSNGCSLLLAKAANAEQSSRIGNQTGGRVFMFLYTDDFKRDYQNLLDNGIEIVRNL
ncbi:MAG: VOC family protein [Ferruginibacter sp.]